MQIEIRIGQVISASAHCSNLDCSYTAGRQIYYTRNFGILILTVSNHFLILAAFIACMVIFVFQLFLLGTVTPSLVKVHGGQSG